MPQESFTLNPVDEKDHVNESASSSVTDSETKINPVSPFKLFKYATYTDFFLILVAIISSMINGISQPLLFLVFSNVIGLFGSFQTDSLVDPQKAGENLQLAVNDLSLTFVMIGAATFVAAYLQTTLWSIIGEQQSLRIRNEYYRSVLSQEIGWFDQHSSGDVATRLSGSVNLVQEGVSDKLGLLLQYFTTFVGGFVLAFTKGWRLTLVLLCVVPLLAACGMVFAKMVTKTSQDQGAYGSAGSIASEVLAAIRTVYSFNATKQELERYSKAISDARRVSIKKSILSGLSMGLVMGILFSSYALAMWYGGQLIKNGDSGPQEVLTVFFNVLIGAMTLGQTSPSITALASAQGAAANLFSVIERESKINPFTYTDGMKKTEAQITPIKGKLEIKNVNFSYPTRPDTAVLKDVSFSIPSGSTVALVGHSGSGKSTSVGLIERFYDPDQGQVLLDGVDISTISTKFLRENIGLVGQEPVLFATTIKNNILFGLSSNVDIASENLQSQVEAACKKTMIHDFIMTLPNQYDTLVGDKGSQLSGGQKQRIAIARAIIKNPRILLLDEATSALDTESEQLVQAALDAASQDRTTVIIAHRLSTIKHADSILVFDKGSIVEQGSHSELLAMKGLYYKLVEAQAVRTESDQLLVESSLESAKEKTIVSSNNKDLEQPHIMNIQPELDDNDGIFKMATTAESALDESQLRVMKLKREPLPILRILKLASPWKTILTLGLLGAIGDGSVFPVYSVVLTKATQSFFDIMTPGLKEKGLSDNAFYSGMFVLLAFGCFLAGTFKIGALCALGDHITYEVRRKSFKAMLNQEIAYYDNPLNNVGSLTARLSTEAEQVQGLVSKVLGALVSALSCVVIGLALAFSNGWKLALVALACLPLTAFGQLMELSSITSGNSKTRKIYLKVSQIAMESIVNIRTVSGLAREDLFLEDYLTRVNKAHKVATKGFLSSGIGYGIAMGSPHFNNALIFWYGTTLVVSGEYTYLSMFQVIMAIMFMGMSIGYLSAEMSTFVKSKIAAIEVFTLWDRVPSIDSSPDVGLRHKPVKGNLDLDSGHFSYPSRPDVPVLQGLSLSVIENKKVALVGASGSGKSTIVSLAQRFYDLPKGSLNMEGIPIKDWNVEHLRTNIAMVGQEPVLFDMSIAENIAYGSETPVTQEDIENVAKMANAHDFIISLPEGYQTRTGECGNQISGGQKQRIAIARALIRNPRLLLLDEATSALDSQSEHLVQQALDQASENRTTITIAHRLSTVQDADLIIVMQQGRCVEFGTHDHLLSLHGYYYSLVHQQSLVASSPSN